MDVDRWEKSLSLNAVVQFYPWLKFYLPLLLSIIMYDNGFQTKESKI